jgi:hypothetical protein
LRFGVIARDRLAAPKQSAGQGTTGGPVSSHDRPDRLARRARTECLGVGGPSPGRAPLLRFSSPTVLAGHARAIRGGRPPDDPASAFRHDRAGPRVLFEPYLPALTPRPCGFPLERTVLQ